ncbi:MAG: hypothetical protein AAGA66_19955 [Bacteroidota bacterium]
MEGEELTEEQLKKLLTEYTGQVGIGFAVSTSRKFGTVHAKIEKGTFFQVMSDGPFFDWYCDEKEYQQFFSTIDQAALAYLKYYKKWKELGRPFPDWYDDELRKGWL